MFFNKEYNKYLSNNLQKGAYGEALAKIMFIQSGFLVYTPEWDDRGVDFVVRKSNPNGPMYDVQVKTTVRPKKEYGKSSNESNPCIYVNDSKGPMTSVDFLKDKFLFVAVRLIDGEEPILYLARGSDWQAIYKDRMIGEAWSNALITNHRSKKNHYLTLSIGLDLSGNPNLIAINLMIMCKNY